MANILTALGDLKTETLEGPSGTTYQMRQLGADAGELVFRKIQPHLMRTIFSIGDLMKRGGAAAVGQGLGELQANDETWGLFLQLFGTTLIERDGETSPLVVDGVCKAPFQDVRTLMMRALKLNYADVFRADLGLILGGVQGLESRLPEALKASALSQLGLSLEEIERVWDSLKSGG